VLLQSEELESVLRQKVATRRGQMDRGRCEGQFERVVAKAERFACDAKILDRAGLVDSEARRLFSSGERIEAPIGSTNSEQ